VFVNPCPYHMREYSRHIWAWNQKWTTPVWGSGWHGYEVEPGFHVGISWEAFDELCERFGLMKIADGGGWIPHMPGDPCPYEGLCRVLLRYEEESELVPRLGAEWDWDDDDDGCDIIGYRPVFGESKS
jgi:hypothetical protein